MLLPPPPPALADLRYGTMLVAGLGHATVIADGDFETYSEAGYEWDGGRFVGDGLFDVGAANYSAHSSFEILTFRYDLKNGLGDQFWRPGMPDPVDLFQHLAAGGLFEAWNVSFERWVWENHCVPVLGWPAVRPDQWRCAMAKSRAHALPGALAKAGEVLKLATQKDADGKRLLDRFSKPRNPTKSDPRLRHHPLWTPADVAREAALLFVHREGLERAEGREPSLRRLATTAREAQADAEDQAADTRRLADYNLTDILSEAEASSLTPDLSPAELRFWQDDQRINRRGIQIDVDSVDACISLLDVAFQRYGDEFAQITGGLKPSEVSKTLQWLRAAGVHLDALDEDAVAAALKLQGLPADARRALEIRALTASASVKKVYALRKTVTAAGRVHDLYNYHGARTGRPTGNGPQPTNLPKAGPNVYKCPSCGRWHGSHTMHCNWCGVFTLRGPKDAKEWNPGAMNDAIEAISYRSFEFVERVFGDVLLTISGVLRGLFIAAPGHELVSSDYTAIEGVVVACIAGEQWRVDAYAKGEPMYLLSAERMFGVSVAEMQAYAKENGHHHPLRQKGKGGELGLGFGGWINALRQFDVDGSDDELKDVVLKWRGASPAIEWLWGGQMKGPADCIRKAPHADRWNRATEMFGLEGMAVLAVQNPGEWFDVRRLDGTPSGVSYRRQGDVLYCRVPSGGLITYHRPQLVKAKEDWRGLQLSFEGWNSNPKAGPPGWIRMNTYSGKLAENVVQKTARDIQMPAIARLEDTGVYPVVMHTYDEIVAEVREGEGSVEELESIMCRIDSWAAGWPIKAAGGWRGRRYRKE